VRILRSLVDLANYTLIAGGFLVPRWADVLTCLGSVDVWTGDSHFQSDCHLWEKQNITGPRGV
jgi:hypothetical protein